MLQCLGNRSLATNAFHRTKQDRMVKQLKLAGISTIEAPDLFIREVYLPDHNSCFGERHWRE